MVSGSGSLNLSSLMMVVCSVRSIILIDDYVTFSCIFVSREKKMVFEK